MFISSAISLGVHKVELGVCLGGKLRLHEDLLYPEKEAALVAAEVQGRCGDVGHYLTIGHYGDVLDLALLDCEGMVHSPVNDLCGRHVERSLVRGCEGGAKEGRANLLIVLLDDGFVELELEDVLRCVLLAPDLPAVVRQELEDPVVQGGERRDVGIVEGKGAAIPVRIPATSSSLTAGSEWQIPMAALHRHSKNSLGARRDSERRAPFHLQHHQLVVEVHVDVASGRWQAGGLFGGPDLEGQALQRAELFPGEDEQGPLPQDALLCFGGPSQQGGCCRA